MRGSAILCTVARVASRAVVSCAVVSCAVSCARPLDAPHDATPLTAEPQRAIGTGTVLGDAAPRHVDDGDIPTPRCVPDVLAAFLALRSELDERTYLSAQNDGVIPWPRYSDAIDNRLGLGEHFQGAQRLGRHLVLTGGVTNGPPMSQLIVVELASRSDAAPWIDGAQFVPSPSDRVVATTDIDATQWHAGGLQIDAAARLLVVALEDDDPPSGSLRFFDVSDPMAPRALDVRVARDRKLYASALSRAADGRWLVLAWDDDVLELLRSRTPNIEDGFDADDADDTDDVATIDPRDVEGGFAGGGCGLLCGTYQAMTFARECDGPLFLVGTRNSQKGSPTLPGDNIASLYRLDDVDEEGGDGDGAGAAFAPRLSFVARRTFGCHDRQCNFGAAAGVHVSEDGRLSIYAAYHWLQGDGTKLLFNEFGEEP